MTFVATGSTLDRLAPGQTLLVRLHGDEPARNVPRTAPSRATQYWNSVKKPMEPWCCLYARVTK